MAELAFDFFSIIFIFIQRTSMTFMGAHANIGEPGVIVFSGNFSEFEGLWGAFVYGAAPAERARRGSKEVPGFLWGEVGFGRVERDVLGVALCFDFLDGVVGVGELHAGIAKDDDEGSFGEGFFDEFEENATVLSARKGDVEGVELVFVFGVDGVDLFDGGLFDDVEAFSIGADHGVEVDGSEGGVAGLRGDGRAVVVVLEEDFWGGEYASAFEFGDEGAAIIVIIGFGPEIRAFGLFVVCPELVESEEVEFGGVDGARFL